MTLLVVYKDGTVRTLCDVFDFSYIAESPFVKFPGPYFFYELDIPLPEAPDCNDSGRILLDEISFLEVFYER